MLNKDWTANRNTISQRIKINTLLIFFFRAGGILCSFILVPLTLKYLDKSTYGVWLTLTSIVSWLSFMDVGLGNGLRNKLAEAAANNDRRLAKEYTSTTYILFCSLMLCLAIVLAIINSFLPWKDILKADIESNTLLTLTYIVIITFCIRLVLELAGIIVISMQKPFIKAFVDFAINILTLLSLYLIIPLTSQSLISFGSIICGVPLLVLIAFTYFIFKKGGSYEYLKPSRLYFRKTHIKSLLHIGTQFFLIQLAALVIFSTDNIIITQLFSPKEVTAFNIAYKYFSTITLIFSIILLPYWSAFTTAFIQMDIIFIKGAFRKLILLWFIQALGIIILITSAKTVYIYWVGNKIFIPQNLNILLGIYVMLYNWNNIFAYFLNGISKIKLQLYSAMFVGLSNIPLSYYLSHTTSLGISAVVLSNCICLAVASLWAPLQCYKILKGEAKGIWNE